MTGEDRDGLSQLRKAAGYTQGSFVTAFTKEAARLGISASVGVRQLRRWESENPPPLPHPNQQVVLEAIFGIPLNEMGFTVPSHRGVLSERIEDDGEVKRRTFVHHSGVIAGASILPDKRGPRIGVSEAAALRARLDNLYKVDHSSGGIPARARAEQMEQQIMQILTDSVYTGRVGRDLQTILCEIRCHRAWFGYDGGPPADARAACMEAMTAAQLVDNPLLQVRALNTLSLLSVDAGRTWEAASAVENAHSLAKRAGAGPTVHLVVALREANAATSAGDLAGARRALSRAMFHQGRTDTGTDVPQWARFAGPVEVDYATAAYYTRARLPARAVSFLRAAVAGLGGGYTRNTAWYRARLAQTLLDMNEVEEACHELTGVLSGCRNVSSARLDRRLRAFEHAVGTFDNPTAREMADLIRETRASSA
ncbi:hypothetical protein ACWEFL_29210 [Streptomyces sp. NPDC004838]